MTKREVNRDMKKLWKFYTNDYSRYNFTYDKSEIDVKHMKKELSRLYLSIDLMNLDSLKAFIIINQSVREVTLHCLGNKLKPYRNKEM